MNKIFLTISSHTFENNLTLLLTIYVDKQPCLIIKVVYKKCNGINVVDLQRINFFKKILTYQKNNTSFNGYIFAIGLIN